MLKFADSLNRKDKGTGTGYYAESFFFTGLTYTLFSCFLLEESAF